MSGAGSFLAASYWKLHLGASPSSLMMGNGGTKVDSTRLRMWADESFTVSALSYAVQMMPLASAVFIRFRFSSRLVDSKTIDRVSFRRIKSQASTIKRRSIGS